MRKLNLGWGAPLLLSAFMAMPLAAQAQNLNGCGPSGNRPPKCQVKVPEIDVGSGLAALAVLLAGLALAYERRRDA
ncbi:MAG TPA: VPEID-CTERM sorting domain-containing protein [Amaricoccus sp.]|jgi:hypothetical protein|nr:VPEID-CTERM sorting domain-containing protein [Amaricoccus sp.]